MPHRNHDADGGCDRKKQDRLPPSNGAYKGWLQRKKKPMSMIARNTNQCSREPTISWLRRSSFVMFQQSTPRFVANDLVQGELIDRRRQVGVDQHVAERYARLGPKKNRQAVAIEAISSTLHDRPVCRAQRRPTQSAQDACGASVMWFRCRLRQRAARSSS